MQENRTDRLREVYFAVVGALNAKGHAAIAEDFLKAGDGCLWGSEAFAMQVSFLFSLRDTMPEVFQAVESEAWVCRDHLKSIGLEYILPGDNPENPR